MHNSQRIHLFIGIFVLSSIVVTGLQCQQYTFGQTDQPSVSSDEKTFRSQFDTFVSSEPTDTECMMKKNLTYLHRERHFYYT